MFVFRRTPLTLVLFTVLWASATSLASAQTCPQKGEVYIKDAVMRASATAAGIPANQNCWNPSNPHVGQEAADAKLYLKTILCRPDGDNYGGAGPDATIDKLNPKFAECAAKFLKAASGQVQGQKALRGGGANSVCIKEGFRTTEKQNQYVRRGVLACTKGAACEHPSGIAIDVNTSSNAGYAQLHKAASGFGLNFYLGFKDPYHFVPKTADCSSAGYRPQDATAGQMPPSSPTAGFTDAIRQALGLKSAQPAFPSQPATPSQPLAQSQSPLSSFNGLPTPLVSDSLVNTGTLATTSSIADRLEDLAFGVRATSTQGATSVPLVINPNDVGGITSTGGQSTNVTTSGVGGSITQNTFTSPDLAGQTYLNSQSRTMQILASLRTALLWMLEYLKPFGGFRTDEVLE